MKPYIRVVHRWILALTPPKLGRGFGQKPSRYLPLQWRVTLSVVRSCKSTAKVSSSPVRLSAISPI
jgi:hypothetical protein